MKMNKIALTLLGAMLALPFACAAPLPEKAELLAENKMLLQFVQLAERPCHFRTALCPERCGHARQVALFRVVVNNKYTRFGRYGDEKALPGAYVQVDARADVPGQDASVPALLQALRPGELLRVTQQHYYVTEGNGSFPVRPFTHVERVTEESLPLPPPVAPAPDAGVMPIAR